MQETHIREPPTALDRFGMGKNETEWNRSAWKKITKKEKEKKQRQQQQKKHHKYVK